MAYKRAGASTSLLRGDQLTAALAGIGMRFAAQPMVNANIEDTLLSASVEALEHDDLRVLAVLMTWLRVHHPWVNADRLLRAVRPKETPRVRVFWAAVGHWLHKDRRLARLTELYRGPRIDLLSAGTDFQIRRAGEDARFAGGPLRVPANVLRDREADVLAPAELAKHHRTYHHRVLMGPTYRADMWAVLDQDPSLPAAALARRAYGSFATAWQVKHDWELLAA
ncbi:MAG: hypothetical protein HY332_23370 [Chloroflexi bacterium]|nr:hypothetical protein [Chloroflexota bacterium]